MIVMEDAARETAQRHHLVDDAVEREDAAAEEEHGGREERYGRSDDPRGGDGGASHSGGSYDDTRMRAIERLLIQLNAAYGGPAWHGPSLRELLDGVTEEQARARPIANAHSILEIVVHVRAWMDAVSERLAGSERELTTEEDWSDVARTSWPAVLDELDNAESRVCDAVARLRPEELDKPVAGKRYSVYVLVHGLIQHNLYHAGQISLLKKAAAG